MLFYWMLSHCAYLHQGMERISPIIAILELEKLKHNKVLYKILSTQLLFEKYQSHRKVESTMYTTIPFT